MTYTEIMNPAGRTTPRHVHVKSAKVLQQLVDYGHIIPVGHHGPCRSTWRWGHRGCRGKLG